MPKRKPEHISQEDWDAVDSPELSDELLAKLKPTVVAHPEFVEAYKRTRGKQKAPTKHQVTIRLDADIVSYYRSTGKGWQTRLNNDLRKNLRT